MPKGFNPLLAFGAGLTSGIESAEASKRARQEKIDDDYRKSAIQLDYETQLDSIKRKNDSEQSQREYTQMMAIAGGNKQNTTNQAQYDALKTAQQNPEIAQDDSITGQASPSPTNTPQTAVTPQPPVQPNVQAPQAAPVQNPVAQGTQSTPTQGGLNSPQGGPVGLSMPPKQGDNTNPLVPPSAQQNDNVDPTGGTPTIPTGEDEITDSFGNKLTRSQMSRAVAYGMEENAKTKGGMGPVAAYWAGIGKVMKEDGQLGSAIKTSGLNSYGFEIGTVPEGFTVPALPETFDPSKRMTEGQASIKLRHDYDELTKDKDKAVLANSASTEFSAYLSGSGSGDEGGLNKIGFIRDFGGALSSTDGQLDSINKRLTFLTVGFERTPGMRLTQAEFFIAREAMPGRGNTPEANQNIAKFWQAKLQLPQEWAQFKQDYMGVNGGWNEAIGERMFQQYQKDNPILDPEILAHPDTAKLSDYKLNEHRMSLDQYAKAGGWNKLKFLGMKDVQNAKQALPANGAADTTGQDSTAPKVIGTWNPKTGKIE